MTDSDRLDEIAGLLRELVAELRAARVRQPRKGGPRRSRQGAIDPEVRAEARRRMARAGVTVRG